MEDMSAGGDRDRVQDLLRKAVKLIRSAELNLSLAAAEEALILLDAEAASFSSKSDFYLAVLFEQLLLLRSASGTVRLFELMQKHILLKSGLLYPAINYSVRAFLKSMHGLGLIEAAAADLVNAVASRREEFGAGDAAALDLMLLLESVLNETGAGREVLDRISQSKAGSENPVESTESGGRLQELLGCVEEILDVGSGRLLGYEDEISDCICDDPQILESFPECAEQLLRCIRKAFAYPVINKIVSLIAGYERKRAGTAHFDLSRVWAEALLNPEAVKHLHARDCYVDFVVLFIDKLDRVELMPVVVTAMPHLGSLQFPLLKKIVEACRAGMPVPQKSLGLAAVLLSRETAFWKRAEACDLLLDLLELSGDLPEDGVRWIHNDIRQVLLASCGAGQESCCSETRLRRLIGLLRQCRQPALRFIDDYLGILANLLIDQNRASEAREFLDEIAEGRDLSPAAPASVKRAFSRLDE
jgi:hypothetical protein